MASRDGAAVLKTAIVRRLNSDFQHGRVPGITETPDVLQVRPRPLQGYPYIYVASITDTEVNKTLSGLSSREYLIHIQVVTRSRHTGTQEATREAIVDEIVRILDADTDDYLDLTNDGYNNYIQNVDTINRVSREVGGSTFFIADMELSFVMDFIGLPQTRQPIQQALYTYAGFEFTPTGDRIEMWDSGTITGAASYSSNNNGWDFTSATYALTGGSQGSLSGNVLTVDGDDSPLGLTASLNYEFNTDTSVTTTLTDTDNWTRIRSIRYGVVPNDSAFTDDEATGTGLRDLSQWGGTNQTFDFGATNPNGLTFEFDRTPGDFMYIVMDSSFTLSTIRESIFNADILNQFNTYVVGGYRVYIFNRGSSYTDTLTLTFST